LLGGAPRLSSRGFRRLRWFPDGNETHRQRRAGLAPDPDWPVDQVTRRPLAELGDEIDRIALGIEPARSLPPGAHNQIGVGFKHRSHSIRLQIGTIGDADFTRCSRNTIEPFTACLPGQFEMAKALAREIESTVDTPQLVTRPAL